MEDAVSKAPFICIRRKADPEKRTVYPATKGMQQILKKGIPC
jgi:hypothetical protein